MALYRYHAFTEKGKKDFGVINADTIDLAKERLRQEKILVTKIFEFTSNKKIAFSKAQLLLFTRDLSLLLHASIPLYESLQAMEEKYRKSKYHPLFLEICDHVKRGSALSDAMGAHPKSFDQVYISMVKAGEETGSLAGVFDELCKLIAKQETLKKKVQSAMTYPIFLASFCVVIIIALFYYLIRYLNLLKSFRYYLPLLNHGTRYCSHLPRTRY